MRKMTSGMATALVVAGALLAAPTTAFADDAGGPAMTAGNDCTAKIEKKDQPWWEIPQYRVALHCTSLEPRTEARGVADFPVIDEYTVWTSSIGTWIYGGWHRPGLFTAPTARVEYRTVG